MELRAGLVPNPQMQPTSAKRLSAGDQRRSDGALRNVGCLKSLAADLHSVRQLRALSTGRPMYEFLLPPGLLDAEPPYWFCVVGTGSGAAISDYNGQPKGAPANARTRVFVLEPGGNEDCFLSRYDARGGYITQTWYRSRDEAVADTAEECGGALGIWRPVPEDALNAEDWVLRNARY